jgi:hypothetical protein
MREINPIMPNNNNPVGPLLNVVAITKIVNMKSCEFLKFLFSRTSNRILKAATRKTQAAN